MLTDNGCGFDTVLRWRLYLPSGKLKSITLHHIRHASYISCQRLCMLFSCSHECVPSRVGELEKVSLRSDSSCGPQQIVPRRLTLPRPGSTFILVPPLKGADHTREHLYSSNFFLVRRTE